MPNYAECTLSQRTSSCSGVAPLRIATSRISRRRFKRGNGEIQFTKVTIVDVVAN